MRFASTPGTTIDGTWVEVKPYVDGTIARLPYLEIATLSGIGLLVLNGADVGYSTELTDQVDIDDWNDNVKPNATPFNAPTVDPTTLSQNTKVVSRTATYGRSAFVGASLDIPASSEKALLIRFPFNVDLLEGFLLNELSAKGAPGDDEGGFEIAPHTDLSVFVGGADVLTEKINPGDMQITLIPAVLSSAVAIALLDSGFFKVEVEEGATVETGVILVTDYDETTGIVSLGTFSSWEEGTAEPVWTGFANSFSTAAKVYLTRLGLYAVPIVGDGAIKFGDYGLDSAPISAGVLLRMPYKNTSGTDDRTMRVVLHVQTGKPVIGG